MGIVADHRHDLADLAVRAKHDAGFLAVKIHRPALFTRATQHLVQAVQVLQMRQQRAVFFLQLGIAIDQNFCHLGVRQAGMGVHHRFHEFGPQHLAFAVDQQFAGHAQTVYFGVQRTQAIGQDFRQHGNDLRRKIHRRAAVFRLVVQGGVDLDIVRDIGDGHQQLPAFGGFFGVHGIVEVAGVLAVNGHQRNAAQIDTALLGFLRHFRVQRLDFLQHVIRPAVRQFVRTDRHLDFHAGGQVVA